MATRHAASVKKEFRAVIKSELDIIVKQFPNVPKIQIPCICDICRNLQQPHFYDYQKLIDRRKIDKKTIECANAPYYDVNVVELINGIEFTNFRRLLLEEKFDDFFNLMKSKFADISYLTKKEKMKEGDFQREFHIFLQENGLETESEHSTNQGRIDNIIKISKNIYIFEHKINENAEAALNQIIAKEYHQKFEYKFDNIFLIGINFSTKKRNIESYKYQKIKSL